VTVAALGRLEPAGEVVNVGGPTGDRIARLEVAEGDYVQQGTVLAYLDSYQERLAERDYAASQLAEARTRLQTETQFGEAQIREAETQRQQIDRPQAFEIEAQRATIRQLGAELELAQIDLRRSQDLVNQGAISRQEYDQQATEVRQRQEQLNNAQANLIRLESARQSDRS
jgi:HlyD family secretion protein